MKHCVIETGSEYQDPASGERQDDYRDVCIYCNKVDPDPNEECDMLNDLVDSHNALLEP